MIFRSGSLVRRNDGLCQLVTGNDQKVCGPNLIAPNKIFVRRIRFDAVKSRCNGVCAEARTVTSDENTTDCRLGPMIILVP